MNNLDKVTIVSILATLSVYVFLSYIAVSGGSFPFLIAILFLTFRVIAVILGAVSFSAWTFRIARSAKSAGAMVGAVASTGGGVIAAGAMLLQFFRDGPFWDGLFEDLLWAMVAATVLLWLGFVCLVVFNGRE